MQDEDVTKLTDEELQARIDGVEPEETAEEVTDTPDTEASEQEEQPEPQEVVEEESEAPQEQEEVQEESKEEAPEEKPPSRRETLRIQQILAKREAAKTPEPSQKPTALDYSEALDADPEVIQQLDADRKSYGQSQYEAGQSAVAVSEFKTNIRLDLPLVKDKLEKLDPRSVEALDREYILQTGYNPGDPSRGIPPSVQNPNIGYAEFMEAQLELAQRIAADLTAQTTKNIAKQAAQTGLRPDGSTAPSLNLNKAPEAMTDEELQAVIKKAGLATQKY